MHANSDTELSRFDREKTFETAEAYRQTTDLLAKVVTALATVQPPPETDDAALYGGYHGFSDSQILASEWSFSTLNEFSTPRPRPRGRACSDFNIEPPRQINRAPHNLNEWTWSGDNQQIQEAFKNRYKGQQGTNGSAGDPYVVQLDGELSVEEQLKKGSGNGVAGAGAGRVKKFSMPDGLRKLFHRKRPSQDVERKLSVVSVPEGITELPSGRSPLDIHYNNTITAGASHPYLRNGRGPPPPPFDSNTSLASASNGGITNAGFQLDDPEQATFSSTGAYQRKSTPAKRRRESIYTQNPAHSARRGSMFPPSSSALAQMQRRGSGSAAMAAVAARRGSLFPATAGALGAGDTPRRSSIFSVTSDKDMDVLEHTTIADLIRALEVVHTHAVLDEQVASNKISMKQRKMGNAGLEPPMLPPILSLFAGDQTRALQTTAASRLYARRSTIVGTMSPAGHGPTSSGQSGRRQSSMQQIMEPPPSYTERPLPASAASQAPTTSTPSGQTKFRRRFSVRPTALQIPPGQAPPPGASLGLSDEPLSPLASTSQTALQRRLSLRPSPLARELSPTSPTGVSGSGVNSLLDEMGGSTPAAARLLPSSMTRPSTSSTHSPLSRIVQISQAQRKSSMPEGFATRKPPGGAGGGSGTGNGNGNDK